MGPRGAQSVMLFWTRVAGVSFLAPVLACVAMSWLLFGELGQGVFTPLIFALPGSLLLLTPAYSALKDRGMSRHWRYAMLAGLGAVAGGAMLSFLSFLDAFIGCIFGMATALSWILLQALTRARCTLAAGERWGKKIGNLMEPLIYLALLLGLGIAGAAGLRFQERLLAEPLPQIAETSDRMPEEAMAQLVTAPMSLVRSGDLKTASEIFERQIAAIREARGVGSVQEADLLMAFGVELFTETEVDEKDLQRAALPYLARSVEVYRAAFGPVSPEVALALNSYADVLLVLNESKPTAEAEAALQEALRIRMAVLGRRNIETVATRAHLARLHGHPSVVKGDRERLARAAAEYEVAISDAPTSASARDASAPMLRLSLAQMYLDNDERSLARKEAALAKAGMGAWTEAERQQAADLLLFMDMED